MHGRAAWLTVSAGSRLTALLLPPAAGALAIFDRKALEADGAR